MARAGMFYPADPAEARQTIEACFAGLADTPRAPYRAILLPHAGWRFCGQTVAKTLASTQLPETAIVMGPKHTAFGAAWSVAPHRAWATPNGSAEIARGLADELARRVPGMVCEPEAHRMEHGTEVLVPFLQHMRPDIKIVPVVIGRCSYEATAALAKTLAELLDEADQAGRPRPLLVISSDLHHYATEAENRRLDQRAIDALVTGDPRQLYDTCQRDQISMCGLMPAVAVMQALRHQSGKVQPVLVDYCNSAKATNNPARVVGYAGMVME